MPLVLARPYPVAKLADARTALEAAARGQLGPLQRLYRASVDALSAIDPDEVEDFRADHPRASRDDQALARAATAVADAWEGVVSIGAALPLDRFRGFAWLAAQIRYEIEPARRDATQLRAYMKGAPLRDTAPEDAALYAALPALIGLGPELADEIEGPCPFPGESVAALLGLPADDDWSDIDPLDAIAVTADTCRAHYAAAPPEWRALLGRCLEHGMIVRPGGGA